MVVNKDDFFKQVTLMICSSLDIAKALQCVLAYLKGVMPADEAIITTMGPEYELSAVAHVSSTTTFQPIKPVSIPPALLQQQIINSNRKPRIINDTELDPYCQAMSPYVNNKGFSELFVPLRIDGETLGMFILRAKGKSRYNDEFLQLLSSVSEPFAIATANALSYRKLLEVNTKLDQDNHYLREELQAQSETEAIGSDRGLSEVMTLVNQIANLNTTVLLLGETGVGKEVIANAIHTSSRRKNGPFIKVNCGAIPESLIDTELFGHEKGAFSGAASQKPGRFERADGGTIFLDEIGELPQQAQVRLLRVLQNKEIERVGGTQSIHVNIRIIAATHRDLKTMVSEGKFREDLWYRLNSFPLTIPPLRERKVDIPELLDYFIKRKSKELGYRVPPPLASGSIDYLSNYPWPGNIRELENVVEKALIQNRGRTLSLESFTLSAPDSCLSTPSKNNGECLFPCLARRSYLPDSETAELPRKVKIDDVLYDHISKVLKMTDGKVQGKDGAAKMLGINASTLRSRMDKLGISYGKKNE